MSLRELDVTARTGRHSENWTSQRELDVTARTGCHGKNMTSQGELDVTARCRMPSKVYIIVTLRVGQDKFE